MSQPSNLFKAYLAEPLLSGTAASEIVLDRITNQLGEQIATGDFADLGRGILTINPDADGITEFAEFAEFTGVDSANTQVTGVTRGLSAKNNTSSTDLMRYHPSGTPVIMSFGSHQIQDLIDYLNALVVSTRSVIVTGESQSTLSAAGKLVYFDDASNGWKLCDATTATTVENTQLAIAQGTASIGGLINNGVLLLGKDMTNSGLISGQKYYASDTPGGISTVPGTKEVSIGFGTVDGYLYFNPRFDQVLTEDQQDALAGTSGTPSSTNLFVTNADTGTSGAGKILRLDGSGKLPAVDGSQLTNTGAADVQIFTANGTWTKPSWIASGNELVVIQVWGGGGGGGYGDASGGAGGGGGAYFEMSKKASQLGATESVTVAATAAGGTAGGIGGTTGNSSSFGSHITVYGGGGGGGRNGANSASGAGGGGVLSAGTGGQTIGAGGGGAGGDPVGGAGGTSSAKSALGGGGGTDVGSAANGGASVYGGGGGGSNSGGDGGASIYGGGGGGGKGGSGGTSAFGGNGGGTSTAGTAPGGGGGGGNSSNGGAGARGEVRVYTFR